MFSSNSTQLKRPLWRSTATALGVLAVATLAFGISNVDRIGTQRVANSTVRLPLSPPSSTGWTTENAFPSLKFFEPTCIEFAKDGSNRVFVLERRGTVVMFSNDRNTKTVETVLDLTSEVWSTKYEDDGAVAIALHPEFGVEGSPNARYFYLLYTAKIGGKRYDRLSRFTLNGSKASDQTVLIDQEDDDLWHNGGALVFGPDGFLYVGVGDEGTNGDGLANGQRIDRDLFCGILRIDVDMQGGDVSHPPRRQPDTGRTAHYMIPNDNPFVGTENALEEFWAHGLRNPFRAAFDSETGDLWVSDVGHLRREEINLIKKGGNYGWSYLEGSLEFDESYLNGQRPVPYFGTEEKPFWEYPHLNGDNCVIGGLVYRASKHPQLQGKYIYADNGSGRVWMLSRDAEGAATNVELMSLPVSSKTGIASLQPDAEGEPLIVILGEHGKTSGTIRRIIASEKGANDAIPQLLSQTGLFSNLENLTPHPGVIPYEINAAQEAGEANIRRWIMLPGDGSDPDPSIDRIEIGEDAWQFPIGTVFVQHFDLPSTDGWKPVETRILVRHQAGGVYGLSYRWNESGNDATLVDEVPSQSSNGLIGNSATSPDGPHDWQFLDRQSCLACHNENAGYVLGVRPRQLNRLVNRGLLRGSSQQLVDWGRAGMFREPTIAMDYPIDDHLVAPDNGQMSIALRARSYLDVNCGACHRPGGARAAFFAQMEHTNIADSLQIKPKQGDFGIADSSIVTAGDPFRSVLYYRMAKLGQGRMPFVGSHRLDSNGLALLRRWIERMPATADDGPSSQVRMQQDQTIESLFQNANTGNADVANIQSLLTDTRGAFALWQQVHDGRGTDELRELIIKLATNSESSPTRDLFEWYVPAKDRTQRLGTQFDVNRVLRLSGDAERGRQLYLHSESLSCRNCHERGENQAAIGPSLSESAKRLSRGDLLHHIIYPSERVEPRYQTWIAQTDDGRILRGLVSERTEDFVTLVESDGKTHRIELESLEGFKPSSQSMMPEHLLQSLTAAEAADLIEYLKSL